MINILVLNGSPRLHGNTKLALSTIVNGLTQNTNDVNIETYDLNSMKLSPCKNCNACKSNGGNCVCPDDSNKIIKSIADSDVIILGTPVYWWGVSAQLKMAIDKMYANEALISTQHKKLGIIAVGAADLTDPEYNLIFAQMHCICDHLGWDLIFKVPISAADEGDLAKNEDELKKLSRLWDTIA